MSGAEFRRVAIDTVAVVDRRCWHVARIVGKEHPDMPVMMWMPSVKISAAR